MEQLNFGPAGEFCLSAILYAKMRRKRSQMGNGIYSLLKNTLCQMILTF